MLEDDQALSTEKKKVADEMYRLITADARDRIENEKDFETLIILNPPSRQVEHLYKDNVSDEDFKILIFQTQRFLQLVWNKRKNLRRHNKAIPGFGKPDGHKSVRTSKLDTKGKQKI